MKYISDILFWISTGLLVPVIVLLILLFIRSLLLTGSFFGEYLRIRKTDSIFTEKLSGLTAGNLPELRDELSAVSSKGENAKPDSLLLETFGKLLSASGSRARRQLLISDYEIAADKDLAVSRTLAKWDLYSGLWGHLFLWDRLLWDCRQVTLLPWPTTCRWHLPPLSWDCSLLQ